MPDPRLPASLPPDVAVKVRAYLGAFLPPQTVDQAVDEVAADSGFWGDTDATEILAVTHGVLASMARVATDVEVLVLNEDVGLPVSGIAAVLALPPDEVRRILDETVAVLADPELGEPADRPTGAVRTTDVGPVADVAPATGAESGHATAPGDAPPLSDLGRTPDGRRRRLVLVAAALVVAAVALAAPWIGLG